MKRWMKIVIAVIAVVIVAAIAVPFIYAAFQSSPGELVSQRLVDDGTIRAEDIEGRWQVAEGSIVGYRVDERIGLATVVAVGRTEEVSGEFEVVAGSLERGVFEAQMASVTSDRSQRDGEFRTRIMDVEQFPVAVFTLTQPVTIPTSTDVATMEPFMVRGDLELRGTALPVDVEMFAAIDDGRLRLTGSTPIVFSDWGIPNPSLPAAMVFTADNGLLEFDLFFTPVS